MNYFIRVIITEYIVINRDKDLTLLTGFPNVWEQYLLEPRDHEMAVRLRLLLDEISISHNVIVLPYFPWSKNTCIIYFISLLSYPMLSYVSSCHPYMLVWSQPERHSFLVLFLYSLTLLPIPIVDKNIHIFCHDWSFLWIHSPIMSYKWIDT